MGIKASMLHSPPTDTVGALHNNSTTQGVRTEGTIETTQAVRLPIGTKSCFDMSRAYAALPVTKAR